MRTFSTLGRFAHSIRVGHATNSSSTHSIILCSEPATQHGEGLGFGWDWFVLVEPRRKLDYLWVDLIGQIQHLARPRHYLPSYDFGLGELPDLTEATLGYAHAFASRILEHTPSPPEGDEDPLSTYIDHDSAFSFPLEEKTGLPHVGFARWFRDQVLDPKVVIVGGNDNSDAGRPLDFPSGPELGYLDDDEYQHPATVYDRGNHWLLWEPGTGLKMRLPKVRGTEILTAPVPELVDIKITDSCSVGCRYCYQGSTLAGRTPTMRAYDIAAVVKGLGVLEVAIGGGEPTEWEGLPSLIDHLSGNHRGINLTTRFPERIEHDMLKQLGRVGFSVDNPRRVAEALGALKVSKHGSPWFGKISIHLTLGAVPTDTLIEIARVAHEHRVPVLLLGYKTDGRGAAFPMYPHDDWIDRFRSAFVAEDGWWGGPSIGVDTAIVERWRDEVKEKLRVDDKWMVAKEGAFSLYVDFVTETFAVASYGAHERMSFRPPSGTRDYLVPELATRCILEGFRRWNTPDPE